jgi:hypothetical protein
VRGWTRSPWFRRRLICNGSFPSCADWRLPGSSGHPSSLSERNGLQAPHPPALATVEAALAADIVGCPGERVNDGPPDGGWGGCGRRRNRCYAESPDLAAMMTPASGKPVGKDRSTSETGHRSDEVMDGAQFRNVVGFRSRPTIADRRVDAMGH